MSYSHLSIIERGQLEALHRLGWSNRAIARELGRHHSTIAREVNRGNLHESYSAQSAQQAYYERRSSCVSAGKYTAILAEELNEKLKETWSPEQIAEKRRVEGKSFVCFKTIYRWIYEGRLASGEVRVLRHKGKRRKPVETRGRFLVGTSISQRPKEVRMLSSDKLANRLCEMASNLSKRSNGYKRRMEAFSRKPDAVVALLERALSAGFTADNVLMDSWFTQAPLLRQLTTKGLSVIGMVKEMKQRYLVQGKRMTLREVFQSLPPSNAKDIKGSIIVHTTCGLAVKLVFVRNRNKKREWLAILSTDVTLDAAEIVRIYGMRWSIETFFKITKIYLKLGTEFQGRYFDQLISHTTIVFSSYLVMEYERRQSSDERTLGGLFFLFADEVRDLDFQIALQQLKSLFLDMTQAKTKKNKTTIFCQLQDWISSFPSYIKGLFGDLSCES